MPNDKMTAGRYLRWHQARRRLAEILAHLATGGAVVVATYTRATRYTAKHAEMFRASRTGLYVRAGKRWDCIDYTPILFE